MGNTDVADSRTTHFNDDNFNLGRPSGIVESFLECLTFIGSNPAETRLYATTRLTTEPEGLYPATGTRRTRKSINTFSSFTKIKINQNNSLDLIL